MNEKQCNGWANYETWVVALWLGNDAGSAAYWDEQARECWDEAKRTTRVGADLFTISEQAAIDMVERLRKEIEEHIPIDGASLYVDLLGAAISEIDWHEIATHMLDDAVDEIAPATSDEGAKRHG